MSLPSVYEYYAGGGITSGLSAAQPYFTLNEKNITIYSGAMHYYRVPPAEWRDRLQKMRAAGLNTVETYIPWNLHEVNEGEFDFGDGNTDFSEFLNITRFLEIAQEEDLLAILRPGPYICTEWDFGGLPSWLLKEKGLRVRSSDEQFMSRVTTYFRILLMLLTGFNWHNGGPVIAYQIENEFGSTGAHDMDYLNGVKQLYLDHGVKELLVTSDGPTSGTSGQIPGVLYTANFGSDVTHNLDILQGYQPGKPSMVMEFWNGWFDHWTEQHHTMDTNSFSNMLKEILTYPSSVNFYMFHGGTNFGFLNGANSENGATDNSGFQPTTNSYDYDAPLNEHGDYTEKYWAVREILLEHGANPVRTPEPPKSKSLTTYPDIDITEELYLEEMLDQKHILHLASEQLATMEEVGQNFGYIVYTKKDISLPPDTEIKVVGHLSDTMMILLNGKLMTLVLSHPDDLKRFGYYKAKDETLILPERPNNNNTLQFIVENWGRVNFGGLSQFAAQEKGLRAQQILINNEPLEDVTISPLPFLRKDNSKWDQWSPVNHLAPAAPRLYKATLTLSEDDEILDTYIDMRGWGKGIIIVNDFVLSRYCKLGPQQAVYLPGSFLKKGNNTILVFEHFEADDKLKFNYGQIFQTV